MNSNLIIGIILSVLFMGPALILISGTLRETKIEKKTLIKLKINYVETFFYLLLYALLSIFIWGLVILKIKSWLGIILFSPFLFIGSIDLIILISHLTNYFKRTIYWDRNSDKLYFNSLFKNFEIDLNSPNLSLINYYPPLGGNGKKGFPGFAFFVLEISDGNNLVKVSNLEYHDLKVKLMNKENYIEKRRQFNIII